MIQICNFELVSNLTNTGRKRQNALHDAQKFVRLFEPLRKIIFSLYTTYYYILRYITYICIWYDRRVFHEAWSPIATNGKTRFTGTMQK